MTEIEFDNGDRYVGEVNAEGQPHGTGYMDYDLNGYYAEYEGQWVNGERSGKGHYQQFSKGGGASHSYGYKGEWLHDQPHGKGVEKVSKETGVHLSTVSEVYTGPFREGKRHGHGKIVADHFDGNFTDGKDRFEGDFLEGHAVGHGVWKYANGDQFEGEFANDRREGPGKYTFKDGRSFRGEWQYDVLQPESIEAENMLLLIVSEHHCGLDYDHKGTFLIPVKEAGLYPYEKAATIKKDSSFDMNGPGLEITAVGPDSVSFIVRGVFKKDNQPVEHTIHRGETVRYEDIRERTARIYDDDIEYTAGDALEVSCR